MLGKEHNVWIKNDGSWDVQHPSDSSADDTLSHLMLQSRG